MNLEGKVVNFLGDSITEGHGVCDIENCRYDNIIKKNDAKPLKEYVEVIKSKGKEY